MPGLEEKPEVSSEVSRTEEILETQFLHYTQFRYYCSCMLYQNR